MGALRNCHRRGKPKKTPHLEEKDHIRSKKDPNKKKNSHGENCI